MRFRLRTLISSLLTWLGGKQHPATVDNRESVYCSQLEGKFTDRVRKVLSLTDMEAAKFGHEYVGPEHILLAILDEGSGVAALVLKNLAGNIGTIRRQMEEIIIRGPKQKRWLCVRPMTPRAVRVIESAKDEAAKFKHDFIGTEHVLLGIMRELESLPVQVLLNTGIDATMVRSETQSILGIK